MRQVARRFGVSKYGISRTVRVILDLVTVKFLGSYGTKPLYAFGIPGLLSQMLGAILLLFVLARKVFPPYVRVHRNPLLPLSIHFAGFGMQCIMMGLLAELLMRTYHESQGKPTYVIRSIVSAHQPETMQQENGDTTKPSVDLTQYPLL